MKKYLLKMSYALLVCQLIPEAHKKAQKETLLT